MNLIAVRWIYNFLHIYIFICIYDLLRENEYPLVERFMYLFMVVLQVCIVFPKTHFGSRGYSFDCFDFFFSHPPSPKYLWGFSLTTSQFPIAFKKGFHMRSYRSEIQASKLLSGVMPSHSKLSSSKGGLIATSNIS